MPDSSSIKQGVLGNQNFTPKFQCLIFNSTVEKFPEYSRYVIYQFKALANSTQQRAK